jgi:uncharacterized protein
MAQIGKWVKRLLLFVGALCLYWGAPVHAASFDCASVTTQVEKMICADPTLSRLDEQLSGEYRLALSRETSPVELRQMQSEWLRSRDACGEVECLTTLYRRRLGVIAEERGMMEATASQKLPAITVVSSESDHRFRFTLTMGTGVSVCDAYLKRLNVTRFVSPPYCDRPEDDTISGFTKLKRIPISANDVQYLHAIVAAFLQLANRSGAHWYEEGFQTNLIERGQFKPTVEDTHLLQLDMDHGWARIWGYSPPIDIDNDGIADEIQVWHGSALPTGIGGRRCGEDITDKFPGNLPLRQPQIAIVVAGAKQDRLDVQRTTEVFGHPKRGYPISLDGGKTEIVGDAFRPIGRSIGIFEFQGTYYFDTFFDSWGDLNGERTKDPNIVNTLAVMLRKDGTTRQICEFVMTDADIQVTGGSK